MKLIFLFSIFGFCMNAQTTTDSIFNGRVAAYSIVRSDYSNQVVDTVVNQKRFIKINHKSKMLEICWDFELSAKREMYCVDYDIEKEYVSSMLNQTTGVEGSYQNYIVFDKDNYPVMLAFSQSENVLYLYYAWSEKDRRFTKSEKVTNSVTSFLKDL